MPAEGLCLRITYTGNGNTVLLEDIHDGADALNAQMVFRKPGPVYISHGQTIELVYTSGVANSFETGAIRTHIDEGRFTAIFVIGSALALAIGGSLPPLAGIVGAVLAEGPIGTLTFRQLVQSEILPDWAITGFSAGTPLIEVSDTIVLPTFSASYVDVARVALAILTDTEGTPAKDVTSSPAAFSSSGTFQKTSINASATFTLTATDSLTGAVDAANTSITWAPRTHWGIGPDGLSTETDIKGLASSALDTNRNRTFTVNPGAAQHIYYAYPASYGAATFSVGGFVGGFVLVSSTISVTNTFGFTTNYRLYKSVAANLGSTTVVVT